MHNEDLHYLYPASNIIRVIESRRMGCAGHQACTGERRRIDGVLVRYPMEGYRFECLHGNLILNGYVRNRMGAWIGFIWHRTGTSGVLL